MYDLSRQLRRIEQRQRQDERLGIGVNWLVRSIVEEFGECCAAIANECGDKPKNLKESAKVEAVGMWLCVTAMFFALGGTIEELSAIVDAKLDTLDAKRTRMPERWTSSISTSECIGHASPWFSSRQQR